MEEAGILANNGWTALMAAALCNRKECVKLLLSECGKQDNKGWTALMYAAKGGYTECI